MFCQYQVYMDPYNHRMRLDLYAWDGTPVNPMWASAGGLQMLPTGPLAAAGSKKGSRKVKRSDAQRSMNAWKSYARQEKANAVLWGGLGLVASGGVLLLCDRRFVKRR